MGALILLSRPPVGNANSEEQLELVQSGAGGEAQFFELRGRSPRPNRGNQALS